MMKTSTYHRALIAVFASEEEGILARSALVSSGVDPDDVAISIDLTRDGIAAEAPGQTYADRRSAKSPWQLFKAAFHVDAETEDAYVLADVERGSVVLTVDPLPRSEMPVVEGVLREHKAIAIRDVRLNATGSSWLRTSPSATRTR